MASELFKPVSESDGRPFIGTGSDTDEAFILTPDGETIRLTPDRDAGTSNGYNNGFRSPVGAGDIPPGSQVIDGDGNVIQSIPDARQRYEDGKATNGPGSLITEDGRPNLNVGGANGVANPIFADTSGLTFNPATFDNADVFTTAGVDPQDIFGTADTAGDRNQQLILNSFDQSRDITNQLISESDANNQDRLSNINDFNAEQQAEAFASLGPDAARALDQNTTNLAAFAEGRLPDALQNEILNQSTRALQAQQSNITGGGISSSFGQRVASQLSIQQRLGLQQSSINASPSFLAQALELRRGSPQKLQFDPNQQLNLQTGIATQLASSAALSPQAAIQSEFQNQTNQLNTQQFNAGAQNSNAQFNSQGQFQESAFNANALTSFQNNLLEYDLFNQKEVQNFEQNVLNQQKQTQLDNQTLQNQQDNSNQQQNQNEQGAQQQSTNDILQTGGQLIPIIDDLISGNDDTPETTNTGGGQVTTTGDNSGDTPPTVTVESAPNPAPQSPPPTSSSGDVIVSPPTQIQSVPTPDGNGGVLNTDGTVTPNFDAEIDNFEPDVSSDTNARYLNTNLGVDNSTMQRSATTPTNVDTRRIQSNRNARANTPNMIDTERLSSSQVQYQDGSTGVDPNKPATELRSVQSPVPTTIFPDISTTEGAGSARNLRATIKAMDRPGLLPKPDLNSTVYQGRVDPELLERTNYSNLFNEERELSVLGRDKFDTVMIQLEQIPVVNDIFETEGVDMKDLDSLNEWAANNIIPDV